MNTEKSTQVRFAACILFALAALAGHQSTASAQSLVVTQMDGGSVVTDLGYNIKVNDGSTLRRKGITIDSPDSPAELKQTWVATKYANRSYSLVGQGGVTPREPLVAVEVRYLTFDMFGKHMKTLSLLRVKDMPAGTSVALQTEGEFRAWEPEVRKFHSSVAFVAHARKADGTVWSFDEEKVAAEIKAIKLSIAPESLSPTPPKE